MNPIRLAVVTTALLALCGAAGAETVNPSDKDPLAVPVAGHESAAMKRDAKPWSAERQAQAQPKPAPDVDPAAVQAATGRFRSGAEGGAPEATAPSVVAANESGSIDAQGSSGSGDALKYWTPERLRKAKPMELPQLNDKEIEELKGGPKNR